MGVETGFIIAGVVAAGLAIGQATGVIDLDPDKAPEPVKTEQAQPAKTPEPVAAPQAPAVQAPTAAPAPAAQPAAEVAPPPAAEPPAAPAPAKVEAVTPAPAEPAAEKAEPPKPAPVAAKATCRPEVNLKGGFVIDMRLDSEGNCVKSGRIRPLMSIECTDGSPPGWFHRYYKDDSRSPVFVTECMAPGGSK